MQAIRLLYIAGISLALIFSVSLAWYLARYKLAIGGGIRQSVTFVFLSTAIFALTVIVTVFVAWPPLLPW